MGGLPLRTVRRAHLVEVSVVRDPAYVTARITEVVKLQSAPSSRPRRLNTRGDAGIWIAPLTSGGDDVAHVMRFTTPDGEGIAVRLSRLELARIRDDAAKILAATGADIGELLDRAA